MRNQVKIKHQSLADKTAEAIVHYLHLNNYQVGSKLPNELELATYFEVSRTTIRQAIGILRERGMLKTERGSGTFIADFPDATALSNDPLGLSLILDQNKLIEDLLEIRMLIEPKCATLAAQNATKRDIQELLKICDELDELVNKGENYISKDMEFHQAIANCCGNLVIHNLIPYIHQMHALLNQGYLQENAQQVSKQHRSIALAIAEHRGSNAYDEMYHHLDMLRGRV